MPIPEEGIPSNLTGTTPPGYHPAYGGAPLIPDPIAAMWQALGGNMDAMPDIQNLASIYNLFNYNQQAQQVAGTPGFSNVNDLLQGKLPQDVVNRIAQSAAERNVMGGFDSDSPNLNASLLSATGLTSLDAQNRGQEQYGNLLGRFPKPGMFDMSSMFVSPEAMQAANAAANVSAAAPNPKAAADAELAALLKAIEAGKGSVPGAGGVPPITMPSGGTPSYRPPAGPVVGTGPQNNIPRYTSPPVNHPWRTNPITDTPTDMIQRPQPGSAGWNLGSTSPNVSNFVRDTVFGRPSYEDSRVSGMGLDPVLNSMFNTAPDPYGFGNEIYAPDMFTGYNERDFGAWDFGAPIDAPDMFTGYDFPTNNNFNFGDTITAPNLFTGNYDSPSSGMDFGLPDSFGQPITSGNWWDSPDPLGSLFGDSGFDSGFSPVTGGDFGGWEADAELYGWFD